MFISDVDVQSDTDDQSDASHVIAPTIDELEQLFPQLEILEWIGCGGMGAVYRARQPKLDRLVALKILRRNAGRDPKFAERFAREARALASLSHPNIVALHDFGEADGLYYFVMEYVAGTNLRETLRCAKHSPADALEAVPKICDALQYAHEEGIVHRDIKPENILLDQRGRIKIADFGLAKLLTPEGVRDCLTAPQQVVGTPPYMAPEQLERPLEVDHRADIYSLGVVFYEMLTRELPIGRFEPPSQKVEVDVRFDEVALRALAKEPARRYQRATDVRSCVDMIARGDPERPTSRTKWIDGRRKLLEWLHGLSRGNHVSAVDVNRLDLGESEWMRQVHAHDVMLVYDSIVGPGVVPVRVSSSQFEGELPCESSA
jgi:serine/threonine protein kinase